MTDRIGGINNEPFICDEFVQKFEIPKKTKIIWLEVSKIKKEESFKVLYDGCQYQSKELEDMIAYPYTHGCLDGFMEKSFEFPHAKNGWTRNYQEFYVRILLK